MSVRFLGVGVGGRGVLAEPWRSFVGEAQDATWRAITPVCSRTCVGGQGEPLVVKKSRAHGAKIGGTRKVLVTPDASLSTPVAEATNHA